MIINKVNFDEGTIDITLRDGTRLYHTFEEIQKMNEMIFLGKNKTHEHNSGAVIEYINVNSREVVPMEIGSVLTWIHYETSTPVEVTVISIYDLDDITPETLVKIRVIETDEIFEVPAIVLF